MKPKDCAKRLKELGCIFGWWRGSPVYAIRMDKHERHIYRLDVYFNDHGHQYQDAEAACGALVRAVERIEGVQGAT